MALMDQPTIAVLSAESTPVSSPASATARRLVAASVSPNTRETYARALRQIDAWRARHPLDDSTLAGYLAAHYSAGATATQGAVARYL